VKKYPAVAGYLRDWPINGLCLFVEILSQKTCNVINVGVLEMKGWLFDALQNLVVLIFMVHVAGKRQVVVLNDVSPK
jgi:hypothetical protein